MRTREESGMLERTRHCCGAVARRCARINGLVFSLTLQQGTILIAVHQIALTALLVLVLLVAVSHLGEMRSMLHSDMADEAELHGFYELMCCDHFLFHEGEGISTNNQKRFESAQLLASSMSMLLYSTTLLMSLYLACCVALLYGAVYRKRSYVVTWIVGACIAAVAAAVGVVVANDYPFVERLFGGRRNYQTFATIGLLAYVYGILCVSLFALELAAARHHVTGFHVTGGDKCEHLLLLDHTAQHNLLSSAQLDKLNKNRGQQFV